jgi:hypothetical protein
MSIHLSKTFLLSCNRSAATSLCLWGSAATESVTNMHGAAWKFRRACQTLVAVCWVPHWHATDTSVAWAQMIVRWSRHHLNSQTVSPYFCLYKHTHTHTHKHTHTAIPNRTQVPSKNWWFNWRHVLHFCPNYPCSIKQIYFHETLSHTQSIFRPGCRLTLMKKVTLPSENNAKVAPISRQIKIFELFRVVCISRRYLQRDVSNEIWKPEKQLMDNV